ncbi:hypothetical protein, partial [Streptomyces sp. SM5]
MSTSLFPKGGRHAGEHRDRGPERVRRLSVPGGGRAGGVHLVVHTAVPGAAAAAPVRTGHTLAGARMTQRGTQDVIVIGAGPGRRADSGTSSP